MTEPTWRQKQLLAGRINLVCNCQDILRSHPACDPHCPSYPSVRNANWLQRPERQQEQTPADE